MTADMPRVLDLVNASLAAGIIANLVFVVIRARALMALGNLAVLGSGLTAMLRLWEVVPFDFGNSWSGWPLLVRVFLALGMVGSAIGAAVEVVHLFRAMAGFEPRPR
ncbi:MAG TPA: hypothetical protein VLJ40_00195 [Arthrobacter sp.]|nr:hypothetical protein [Arthrobacter sp.]